MSIQTLHLRISDYSNDLLEGIHWSSKGRGSVLGHFSRQEGEISTFHLVLRLYRPDSVTPAVFNGVYFPGDNEFMSGQWQFDFDDVGTVDFTSRSLVYARMPAELYALYPSLAQFEDGFARARWTFAITAVVTDLRRRRWSWSYFKKRREERKAFLSLYTRLLHFGRKLSENDDANLRELALRILPADGCFYLSRVRQIRARTTVHRYVILPYRVIASLTSIISAIFVTAATILLAARAFPASTAASTIRRRTNSQTFAASPNALPRASQKRACCAHTSRGTASCSSASTYRKCITHASYARPTRLSPGLTASYRC
jgi:hypothetical protein